MSTLCLRVRATALRFVSFGAVRVLWITRTVPRLTEKGKRRLTMFLSRCRSFSSTTNLLASHATINPTTVDNTALYSKTPILWTIGARKKKTTETTTIVLAAMDICTWKPMQSRYNKTFTGGFGDKR